MADRLEDAPPCCCDYCRGAGASTAKMPSRCTRCKWRRPVADRFEDHRGVIQDLLGPVDAVTEIFTRAGSLRGNHLHRETIQWTYFVSGHMRVVTRSPDGLVKDRIYGPGELSIVPPGTAHAWQTGDEDCTVLVFARGPRAGENYESDVVRLTGADMLIQ